MSLVGASIKKFLYLESKAITCVFEIILLEKKPTQLMYLLYQSPPKKIQDLGFKSIKNLMKVYFYLFTKCM